MGQEILYCFKCQERVTSADLDSANALRFGNRTACRKCVPDLLASLTSEERKDLVARVQSPKKASSGRFPSAQTPRPKAYGTVRPDSGSNQVVLWGLGAVVLVIVVAIVVLLSGSGSSPPPPREVVVPPAPRGPEESLRDRTARETIAKAKSLAASDPEAALAAFETAVRISEGTAREREAKELRDEFIGLRKKALVKEFAGFEVRARVVLQKEEFGSAIAIYDSARPLHPGAEWKALVDAKVDEVRKTVDGLYGPLKDQASAARAKGQENDLKSIRDRVGRWGLADKAADLDAHLRNLPPPPPDPWPWVPLFDGKSLDFLVNKGEGAWTVENGAIVRVKGKTASAQSRRGFTNGEVRIRLEWRELTSLALAIRQGYDGAYSVFLDRAELRNLEGREHEVVLVFRGSSVTATLNGQKRGVEAQGGTPLKGALQFNIHGEWVAVKSIEYRDDPASGALVGHWTFDDGKAADSSGLRNEGTLEDKPVPVAGRIGNALQFDGRRAHVVVPSSSSLTIRGPLTLAAWVNPGPAGERPLARGVVEKWDPGGDTLSGYFLRLSKAGHAHFHVSEPGKFSEVFSIKPLTPDTWTFLAAVFDGSSVKLYVNGTPDRSSLAAASPGPSKGSLKIGMGGGGGGVYFGGAIDDVRVYNRALSAEEVARLAAR